MRVKFKRAEPSVSIKVCKVKVGQAKRRYQTLCLGVLQVGVKERVIIRLLK